MESVIKPFVQKSMEINLTCLNAFDDKLGLPKGTLASKHGIDEPSCCEARCIKKAAGVADDKKALGSHTDFGSLVGFLADGICLGDPLMSPMQSFLHNRTGGLQVLPPDMDEWQYIKVSPRSTF